MLGMGEASMFGFCFAALACMLTQPVLPHHKLNVREGEGGMGGKEGRIAVGGDEDACVCLISGLA